jgi:ornithine--oxo-acid transaminase
LDHASSNPSVAGTGQPFLPAFSAALVGRAREAGIARYGPAVAHASRQYLLHQHVGRLDTNPYYPRQQAHHGVGSIIGRLLDAQALEQAITPNTVAFLVEPIQGEAGVLIPPSGYFAKVRELCSAHDVMLILDEIQTGLGRTGKLLAEQHDGIEADVTLLGKALSGGFYPVSAVLSNNAVLGTLKPGQHGSTFGGNPLACAVARAALRVLVDEGMIENAALQGVRFLDGLRSIRANTIREVRGRGLMLAVELHLEAAGARRYCEALQSRGILAKDTHEHTIRVAPPLVITSDQVDWALDRFGATLRQDFS